MRASKHRTKKYKEKIRGFILPGQVQRKAASVEREVDLERKVEQIVGVDLMRGYYMIFAKEVNKLYGIWKGVNLMTEIAIKEMKWTSRGLDPLILNQIEALFGTFVFRFDEGRFNLCVLGG